MVATIKPWIKFLRNVVHTSLENFKSRCDEFPEHVLQLLDWAQWSVVAYTIRNQVHQSNSPHLLNLNFSFKSLSYHSLRWINKSWTNPYCMSSRGNAIFNPNQTEENPVFCHEKQSSLPSPPKPAPSPCMHLLPCPCSFSMDWWDLG